MTLLSLYHTHAEVCLQMAASSKSLEIKERWLELADHWRQKANDSEGLTGSAAQPLSQPLPVVVAPKIFGKHTLSNAATTEPPPLRDVMMALKYTGPIDHTESSSEGFECAPFFCRLKAGGDVDPVTHSVVA